MFSSNSTAALSSCLSRSFRVLILIGILIIIIAFLYISPLRNINKHRVLNWLLRATENSNFREDLLLTSSNSCENFNIITDVAMSGHYHSVDWLESENNNDLCSVPVFAPTVVSSRPKGQTGAHFPGKSRDTKQCTPTCTNRLFKDYNRNHSRFVREGFWEVKNHDRFISLKRFVPKFCSFTDKSRLDTEFIRRCLVDKKIRRIVTMGDSNGHNIFQGILHLLSPAMDNCSLVKAEEPSFVPNLEYYVGNATYSNSTDVHIEARHCRSCTGRRYSCYYTGFSPEVEAGHVTLILEHVAMNRIIDSSIRILRPIPNAKPTNITQEFLLRDYLHRDAFPELLVIPAPFAHEIGYGRAHAHADGIRPSLRHLLNLIKTYVPNLTDVYWLPAQRMFLPKRSPWAQRIKDCNSILFEVLRDDMIREGGNIHGFLDLFELSCPLKRLSRGGDRVHMKSDWYNTLARHLIELHCT